MMDMGNVGDIVRKSYSHHERLDILSSPSNPPFLWQYIIILRQYKEMDPECVLSQFLKRRRVMRSLHPSGYNMGINYYSNMRLACYLDVLQCHNSLCNGFARN